jgi:hypothetical protein
MKPYIKRIRTHHPVLAFAAIWILVTTCLEKQKLEIHRGVGEDYCIDM